MGFLWFCSHVWEQTEVSWSKMQSEIFTGCTKHFCRTSCSVIGNFQHFQKHRGYFWGNCRLFSVADEHSCVPWLLLLHFPCVHRAADETAKGSGTRSHASFYSSTAYSSSSVKWQYVLLLWNGSEQPSHVASQLAELNGNRYLFIYVAW